MLWATSFTIFCLFFTVRVYGLQKKGSIRLLRQRHRSAAALFDVPQGVQGDDTAGESKSGKYRARRGTGKSLISDLENILGGTRSATDRQVADHLAAFIDASDELLNRSHALAMTRLAAKYRFDLTAAIPLAKVVELFHVKRLIDTSHEVEPIWEGYMLSQVIYGLRMFNMRTPGIGDYLTFICERVEEAKQNGRRMNNQEFANSLYGLQQFENSPLVDRLALGIVALSSQPEDSRKRSSLRNTFGEGEEALDEETMREVTSSPMNGQEISMSIYGMRSMSTSHAKTKSSVLPKVLDFIALKVVESPATLSPRACANALNGLRGLNPSKLEACKRLLEVLLPKILATTGSGEEEGDSGQTFDPIAVGSALSGMKAMDAKTPAVLTLLDALAGRIEQSQDIYNQDTVASCMVGMQYLSDEEPSVRRVLAALTEKLNRQPGVRGGTVTWEGAKRQWSSVANEGLSDVLRRETVKLAVEVTGETLESTPDAPEDTEAGTALFSAGNIALCLTSMRYMTGKHPQTRGMLDALQRKIMLRAHQPFRSQDIGRCLYGLQSISITSDQKGRFNNAARVLVGKLAEKLDQMEGDLMARDVGSALYGLKNSRIRKEIKNKERAEEESKSKDDKEQKKMEVDLHSEDLERELKRLLTVLAVRIATLPDTALNAQSVGMALLGMKSMSSDAKEVQQVLHALTPRIKVSTLDRQACANILYSMSKMSSGRSDVRNFLSALAPKIAACVREGSEGFTPQEISNSFYGLQNMDSKHVETLAVLVALNKGLKHACTYGFPAHGGATMTSQGVGNALSGFQTMENSNNHVVDESFGLLVGLMGTMQETMSPKDLANAFMGLQGIEQLSKSVTLVLEFLLRKMRESTEQWSAREIGYALVGMSGLQQSARDSPEVAKIVGEINLKLSQSELQGMDGVTFKLFGKGFKIMDATGAVIMKG